MPYVRSGVVRRLDNAEVSACHLPGMNGLAWSDSELCAGPQTHEKFHYKDWATRPIEAASYFPGCSEGNLEYLTHFEPGFLAVAQSSMLSLIKVEVQGRLQKNAANLSDYCNPDSLN